MAVSNISVSMTGSSLRVLSNGYRSWAAIIVRRAHQLGTGDITSNGSSTVCQIRLRPGKRQCINRTSTEAANRTKHSLWALGDLPMVTAVVVAFPETDRALMLCIPCGSSGRHNMDTIRFYLMDIVERSSSA
jgi:hypothetical protein